MDEFILYFPFILLLMALFLVLIESSFVRIFNAGLKLDMIYGLLVKDQLLDAKEDRDDVDHVDGVAAAVADDLVGNSIDSGYFWGSFSAIFYFIKLGTELQ